jgi:hypothetical protein
MGDGKRGRRIKPRAHFLDNDLPSGTTQTLFSPGPWNLSISGALALPPGPWGLGPE